MLREKRILRDVYKYSAKLITVSEHLKKQIQNLTSEKNIVVIPNMVNINFFTYNNNDQDRNQIFSLGSLRPKKGFDVLIKAFAKCLDKEKTMRLKIGGDGPEKKKLQSLIDRLGITENVELLGLLKQESVNKYLNESGIFVLTSHVETFGVVLIEAMSMGLPVISTRSGGTEELVNDENGLVCEVGDVDGIKTAILHVYKNYSKYNPSDIRAQATEKFSSDHVVEKIVTVYKEIVEH